MGGVQADTGGWLPNARANHAVILGLPENPG
jgi:hypothetical protein